MRNRIFVHIGINKTGTTSFQSMMTENSLALEKAGLTYPTGQFSGGETAHHRLFVGMLDAGHRQFIVSPFRQPLPTFEESRNMLRQQMRVMPESAILLSSEFLWLPGAFDEGVLTQFRDSFPDCTIEILAVLRDIPDHAISMYGQSVVGPRRVCRYYEDEVQSWIKRKFWDYEWRLDSFARVFGREAVHPFWYDRASTSPFPPFMPLLGLDATTLASLSLGAKNLNRSPTWPEISDQLGINRAQKLSPLLGRLARRERRWGKTRLLIGAVRPDPRNSSLTPALNKLQEEQTERIAAAFPAIDRLPPLR